MARQRFIHPELWSDPTVGQLTPVERLFFVGCFSNADDEGRLLGSPAYLRSIIFPYDDFTIEQVKQMRDRIIDVCKNFTLYLVDGVEYLTFQKWSSYQKPKYPKPSKLPSIEESNNGETMEKPFPKIEESMEKPLPHGLGLGRVGLGLDRVGFGEKSENQPTNPQPEENSDLTETERALLKEIKSVPGYPFDYEKDLAHIRTLAVDFPGIDLFEQLKKWRTYKIDKPLNKNSNPRLQFRNWCEIAEKQRLEKRGGQPNGRDPTGDSDPLAYKKTSYYRNLPRGPGPGVQ